MYHKNLIKIILLQLSADYPLRNWIAIERRKIPTWLQKQCNEHFLNEYFSQILQINNYFKNYALKFI